MADFTDLNTYFESRIDQYHQNIYGRWWRTDPYASLVPVMTFDFEEGLIPTVLTTTGELPTAYPTSLTALARSTGTGNAACNLTPTTIKTGAIERTFRLEGIAWQSDVFCLTDIELSHQAAKMAGDAEKVLGEYYGVFMSDYHRIKSLAMSEKKSSTTTASALTTVTDSAEDYSALSGNKPVSNISWDHLDNIYDDLNQRGANQFAVGYADGEPVYSLTGGSALIRSLWRDDTNVRTDVQYADPNSNFLPRGIKKAVRGMIPNVDIFPIRLDTNLDLIYPTANADTSLGRTNSPNPNYKTVANGGTAVYETVIISALSGWERHVRPPSPRAVSQMEFDDQNYSGDIQWINNKDNDTNKLGNQGYYYMESWQAAKPVYPEFWRVLLTLAVDA